MVEQQQSHRWGETEGETESWSPVRRLNLSNVQNVSYSSTPLYCGDSLLAGRPGDRIPVGCGIPHPSRPALGPTQFPIQRVPDLSRGKAAGAWC